MQGFWSRKVFQNSLHHFLFLKSNSSAFVFITKISEKEVNLTIVKFDGLSRCVKSTQKRRGSDGVGDHDDAFSPVPAASGFRTILSLATQLDTFFYDVDISQQGDSDFLPGESHNGNVCISSPPGYEEDSRYTYHLLKQPHGMPPAARACHTTMSALLGRRGEGCKIVRFETKRTCGGEWSLTVTAQCLVHTSTILLIACANRQDFALSQPVFWRHLRAHTKALQNTILQIRKPFRTLPWMRNCPSYGRWHYHSLAKALRWKDPTSYDRINFGTFCHTTHLWQPTLAFQKPETNSTPITNCDTSLWWTVDLFLGRASAETTILCLLPKQSVAARQAGQEALDLLSRETLRSR